MTLLHKAFIIIYLPIFPHRARNGLKKLLKRTFSSRNGSSFFIGETKAPLLAPLTAVSPGACSVRNGLQTNWHSRRAVLDSPSGSRCDSGFSLIELLVAMLLLTIVITGSMAIQVTVIRASTDTKSTSTATALAQSQIEIFRSADFSALQTVINQVECFDVQMNSVDCSHAYFTRTSNVSLNGNTFQITVDVQWGNAEGVRKLSMTMERQQ